MHKASRAVRCILWLTTFWLAPPCLGKTICDEVDEALAEREQRTRALAVVPSPLDSMPEEFRKEWEEVFGKTVQVRFENKDGTLRTPGANIEFGKRFLLGDENAVELLELGWERTFNEKGNPILQPPKNTSVIFRNSQNAVNAQILKGRLKEPDAIHLAITFKAVDGGPNDYIFIRPGIDPWPPPGKWKIVADAKQLPHRVFYAAVADGKMPFFVGQFLSHDLSHWTELQRSPEIMKLWRAYGRQVIATPEVKPTTDSPQHTDSELRSFFLAEWLSVPDIRKENQIRALLPVYFGEGAPQTRASALQAFRALGVSQRQKRIETLLSGAEPLLLRQGGGLRDDYNSFRYVDDRQADRVVLDIFSYKKKDKEPWHWDENVRVPNETLHAQLAYIRFLYRLKYFPEDRKKLRIEAKRQDALVDFLPTGEELEKILDALLEDRVVRTELAFQQAVVRKITPEKLHREARLSLPPKDSDTYQFFASYAAPDSLTARAFGIEAPKPSATVPK